MKKIYILLGHPDKETFSGALADAYQDGARKSGCEVRRTNLGDLHFDPILHKGYKEIQPLEPDLKKVQEDILWADHVVILYPNWWITMPALLKGMFDRMFLPGFAFNFDKKTHKTKRLLTGKSARVIVTSGTYHPLMVRFLFGEFTNEISRGILGFSGIRPVKVTCFGPADWCRESKKEAWKRVVYRLGLRGT